MKTFHYPKKVLFAIFVLGFYSSLTFAQTDMTIFSSNMRSRATNVLYDEEFKNVGVYKVKGNSYLLKGNNVADLFTNIGVGINVALVFDSYTQDLSVMLEDKKSIVKVETEEVDSFYLKVYSDALVNINAPAMFVNMRLFDPSVKMYMQRLSSNGKYRLFKSYYADMISAASDLAQTNVKEFEVRSDYYLLDSSGTEIKLIKIKPKAKNLKELFKEKKEALELLNKQGSSYENNLVAFVEKMNGGL